MCGIFAVVNDKANQAAATVIEGLKKLEYRGYDSWGIAVIPENESTVLAVEKHIGKIGEAETTLPSGKVAIGHTRWATHGGVTDENTHPHFDCTKKIAVIHNGIVENYKNIKDKLIKKGHRFISETDTEVIAHLIEENAKNTTSTEAVFRSFAELTGSNAIGVIDMEQKKIFACRNGSPLVIGKDTKNHQYFIGSDTPAFIKHTNLVHFMEDGEGVEISDKGVTLYDLSHQAKKSFEWQKIDYKMEDAEKEGFPHFLLKEINEQKKTIVKTTTINEKEILQVGSLIRSGFQAIFSGCGTAGYCALAGKYFMAENGFDSQTHIANEFLPFSRFSDKKTLFIAISQSGETADTLIAAKQSKKTGAKIVAVINARGSTLERLADIVIPISAGPEIAVVSTKAFTAQLATLYLIAAASKKNYSKAVTDIKNLSLAIDKWLNQKLSNRLINLAKSLLNEEHIYVIGKNRQFPAALEFALKIKETSYLHAEAFAAGELKHGVITLIQKNTPCFVLAEKENREEILSSASELKSRGGRIIGISPFEATEFAETIKTPDLGNLTLFANIIAGQLLGYYLGIGRGTDPDKPRNLAKSVTVK